MRYQQKQEAQEENSPCASRFFALRFLFRQIKSLDYKLRGYLNSRQTIYKRIGQYIISPTDRRSKLLGLYTPNDKYIAYIYCLFLIQGLSHSVVILYFCNIISLEIPQIEV